jgi:hypothetical protein
MAHTLRHAFGLAMDALKERGGGVMARLRAVVLGDLDRELESLRGKRAELSAGAAVVVRAGCTQDLLRLKAANSRPARRTGR